MHERALGHEETKLLIAHGSKHTSSLNCIEARVIGHDEMKLLIAHGSKHDPALHGSKNCLFRCSKLAPGKRYAILLVTSDETENSNIKSVRHTYRHRAIQKQPSTLSKPLKKKAKIFVVERRISLKSKKTCTCLEKSQNADWQPKNRLPSTKTTAATVPFRTARGQRRTSLRRTTVGTQQPKMTNTGLYMEAIFTFACSLTRASSSASFEESVLRQAACCPSPPK